MLRLYADRFVGLCGYLAQMEIYWASHGSGSESSFAAFADRMQRAREWCLDMDLRGSVKVFDRLAVEIRHNGENWPDNIAHLIGEAKIRIQEELEERTYFAISPSKAAYADPKWLIDDPIDLAFPSVVRELQKAGRCYAYDENTACMFHLMRVVDFGLRSVSASLQIPYNNRAWDGIGKAIQSKMEAKYQDKPEDWKKTEPIYAEILTDIKAIGRGHRNPCLHELEKHYEANDAKYMLTVVEGFMSHLAKHAFREERIIRGAYDETTKEGSGTDISTAS